MKSGFTLIELMIIIVIIAILGAMVFSVTPKGVHSARVSTVCQPANDAGYKGETSVVIDGHTYVHDPACPNPVHKQNQ